MLREEVERERNVKREEDKMTIKLLKILKYALESGKESDRKDIISPLQGAIDDINKFKNNLDKKNVEEDD